MVRAADPVALDVVPGADLEHAVGVCVEVAQAPRSERRCGLGARAGWPASCASGSGGSSAARSGEKLATCSSRSSARELAVDGAGECAGPLERPQRGTGSSPTTCPARTARLASTDDEPRRRLSGGGNGRLDDTGPHPLGDRAPGELFERPSRSPPGPSPPPESESLSSAISASASASGSRGGTSRPVTPSSTISGSAPTFVVTQGSALPIASTTTCPKASNCVGSTNTRGSVVELLRALRGRSRSRTTRRSEPFRPRGRSPPRRSRASRREAAGGRSPRPPGASARP